MIDWKREPHSRECEDRDMSHVLELTDEQYALMKKIGDETGRTPEEMLLAWTMEEESVIAAHIPPTTRRMTGFVTWV